MRNHTTPKLHELSSQAGKNPSVTPTTSGPQSVIFNMNSLPTGKNGKFWYYCTAIWLMAEAEIEYASSADTDILGNDSMWQILNSIQVQCPVLGQLFSHANTRGAVLGNIVQFVTMGYNAVPYVNPISAGETKTVRLYYRIPFSYEFLRKPHETSPWAGFLEGGSVEIKTALSNVFDTAGYDDCTVNSINFRCVMSLIPSPEAVIHTPVHWREHQTPGGSTKHIITDLGSPDGLQGVDQSKGVGVACLFQLTNLGTLGLGGQCAASAINGFDIPWRDQDRVDVPDLLYADLYTMMGNGKHSSSPLSNPVDAGGFPMSYAAIASAKLNSTFAMVVPFVAPGRDCETSKLQTVAGAKAINLSYNISTPSGINVFLGCYFPQFDEQFAMSLAARIAPGAAGKLEPKTLNKQAGGIPGVGKLAYVRLKVK